MKDVGVCIVLYEIDVESSEQNNEDLYWNLQISDRNLVLENHSLKRIPYISLWSYAAFCQIVNHGFWFKL